MWDDYLFGMNLRHLNVLPNINTKKLQLSINNGELY